MPMRAKLIAANWKMHKTIDEAMDFSRMMKRAKFNNDIIIFPSYPLIQAVQKSLGKSKISIGAQNCHQEEKGAFTGEVSASMLKSIGCDIVLLGHSERRGLFHEDDALINRKIKAALMQGLEVMLCVGETESEREKGMEKEVLKIQLKGCLEGINAKEMQKIALAYEPVWSIGTGKNASPQQAQNAHTFIRHTISSLYSDAISKKIRILYGGSVTSENAASLFKEKDIDGALVGGASLDVEKFLKIANAA